MRNRRHLFQPVRKSSSRINLKLFMQRIPKASQTSGIFALAPFFDFLETSVVTTQRFSMSLERVRRQEGGVAHRLYLVVGGIGQITSVSYPGDQVGFGFFRKEQSFFDFGTFRPGGLSDNTDSWRQSAYWRPEDKATCNPSSKIGRFFKQPVNRGRFHVKQHGHLRRG